MLRGLADSILLFLLPFAAYWLFLTVRRRYSATLLTWSRGPVMRLVAVGLALAVAGTVLTGIFGDRYKGDYIPAHLQNGILVPGRME